jgi:hypothetical protein
MHLVKWFRKNMTKLMAIFVILIMVAFIMPSVLQQLARPRSGGADKPMWYFYGDKKITPNDIRQATSELSAMKMLYVDDFLLGQPDLRFKLLGQLIFPQATSGAVLSSDIKRIIIQNQYRINPERIDEFFAQATGRAELFWILLKAEAKNAGCAVVAERAGGVLNMLVPKITNNKVDAATAVQNAGRACQMTDDMVLGTFGNILAVISYVRIVTDTEDITEAEMAAVAAKTKETVNAEFVEFSNETFVDKVSEPDEKEIAEQFEKYKNYYAGTITEENPYGFGYKQKPRVALEYMIIKFDDVKKLVTAPKEEEAEEYYRQNLETFIEKYPQDPNNPDSEMLERQQSYAEVADNIRNSLLARKVSTKAMGILNDAIEQVQTGFDSLNFETATVQQFKENATDYSDIAEKIAQQHDIKIYSGKTALLTKEEIQTNGSFGSLVIQTQSGIPTRLARLVFATEQLGDEASNLGPFEPVKPKVYVSIGPIADNMGTIMAVVRVIETKNSVVPTDINFRYEKNLPLISQEDQQQAEKSFVLKDEIRQDCRKLAAFELTCQKANEFVKTAKDEGWDKAIKKYNLLYPVKDPDKQKTFEIQKWDQKNRLSQMDIETLKLNVSQSPLAEGFINQTIIYAKLINAFYSLFKPEQLKIEDVPAIIEFKPQLTCYAIKSLSRQPETTQNYEQTRQKIAFRENHIMTQSMAVEYFMPDNILKRVNLKATYEPNAPAEQTIPDADGAEL